MDYYSKSVKQTTEELKTNIKIGLSGIEADKRFKKYGPNIIPDERKRAGLILFFNQFKSPLVYVLIIAAFISFVLGHAIDGWIILGAVAISVFFGYFQESKAEKSLQALKQVIKKTARVLRDGREQEIDAVFLVQGDVLLFEEGERVPADARIFSSINLETDESSLTGESLSQEKNKITMEAGVSVPDRKNMIFTGTVVSRGYGVGIVTAVGLGTEIGKIAESLRYVEENITPLQKRFAAFSKWITLIIVSVAIVIFTGGILRGLDIVEIFLVSVAVAVASIPQGLIPAISVILAIGMTRLLKKRILVRKMVAAETLGSTTIICSDKTGTITEGKMSVTDIFTAGDGKAYSLAMKIIVMCSAARITNPQENFQEWEMAGESTEKAILESAVNAGFSRFYFKRLSHLLDEIPFESRIRYRAVMIKGDKEILDDGKNNLVLVAGAPEKILESSHYLYKEGSEIKFYISHLSDFKKEYLKMTQSGLRVLAVAYRKIDKNIKLFKEMDDPISELVFVGFLALKDPIRESVGQTVLIARKSGIKVAIITGDHRNTATAIAKEIGLEVNPENILEGKDLEAMDDEELRKVVKKITVYARILPHDKLRIVEALKAQGEVVAMTGDGINDAPALKKADIGIAVGAATDVAKEVSGMILLDNNFNIIIEAVRQGRIIFDNIKKVVTYVLADSFTEVILIGGSLLLGFPLPLIPAQILWTNLIEDGLPTFALAFEPEESDVMERKPNNPKDPLIDSEMKIIIFIVGIVTDLLLFGIFYYLLRAGVEMRHIRTIIFVTLGTNSLLYIFCIRSLKRSILATGVLSNKYLLGSVFLGFFMLFTAVYFRPFQIILQTVNLSFTDWIIVLGLGFIEIIAIETTKWIFARRRLN